MVSYNEVSEFISSNHRNPSKYADEERRMKRNRRREGVRPAPYI